MDKGSTTRAAEQVSKPRNPRIKSIQSDLLDNEDRKSNLRRHEERPIFKRIITVDETWFQYNHAFRQNSWRGPCQLPQKVSEAKRFCQKPDRHTRNSKSNPLRRSIIGRSSCSRTPLDLTQLQPP